MDEWYLIRSDDHDMDKDIVITAEIMDAVKDMASVMVTCRISVQDPMRKLALYRLTKVMLHCWTVYCVLIHIGA